MERNGLDEERRRVEIERERREREERSDIPHVKQMELLERKLSQVQKVLEFMGAKGAPAYQLQDEGEETYLKWMRKQEHINDKERALHKLPTYGKRDDLEACLGRFE